MKDEPIGLRCYRETERGCDCCAINLIRTIVVLAWLSVVLIVATTAGACYLLVNQ